MDNIFTSFIGLFISGSQTVSGLAFQAGSIDQPFHPLRREPMFQRTKICSGLLLAFGGTLLSVAPGAFAQDTTVQRVEITGSSIKRVDAETSVPVTVIKADDLKKQGVTTVEGILQNISAAQIQQTAAQSVGSSTGGASFADLRGL